MNGYATGQTGDKSFHTTLWSRIRFQKLTVT